MRTELAIAIGVVGVVVAAACHPKADKEDRCHDVVAHMRKVSAMPMRDGDVMMFMGACKMWSDKTIDCMLAANNDDELKACRAMEH